MVMKELHDGMKGAVRGQGKEDHGDFGGYLGPLALDVDGIIGCN